MSDQPVHNRLAWRAMAVAALGWSITGALGWSFFDASPLADEIGVAYFEAWTAAVAAGVKVALVMLPLGLVAGWFWHRSTPGRLLRRSVSRRPAHSGALLIAAVFAFVLLSYATYGALTLFRAVFGSQLVHKLALSIWVPVAAIVAGLLAFAALGPLRSLLGRLGSSRLILPAAGMASLALVAAWTAGLIALGHVVWQSVAVQNYLPVVVIGACSIIGALVADVRRARQVAMVTALIALPVAGFSMLGETSKELRLALVYRETGTGFVSKLTNASEAHSFGAAEANAGRSAVCGPGVEPPRLSDVGRADAQAPDIVWLTVDAFRWDHTSMSGYERDTTPHIARHAREAAVFERASTPASSTRQTMRALFTGVHPSMIAPPHGPIYALTLDDEQHTLAEFLRAAGYHTLAWSSDAYIFSEDHGALQGFERVDDRPFELKETDGYSAPYIIDEIIEELGDDGGPKFVWTHLIEPHAPFRPGPDPVDFGPDEIDRYDAALRFVDAEIGRLLEFVAARQQTRPTYVVITADHGEAFGEHGRRRHGYTIFQEETHVPLVVIGPDIVAARYDEPVGVLDLFPTTFELAGLEVPRGSCGQSLADVLRSERAPQPRPVFVEQVPDSSRTHFSVGFIRGSDKLVLQPTAEAISVFDLDEDPGETHDLAPQQPERLERHLDALRDYLQTRGMRASDYGLNDAERSSK